MSKNDLSFITQVRSSEKVQTNVGTHLFTNEELQEEWYLNTIKDRSKFYGIIEYQVGETWQKIGYVRVTEIDHLNKSMCVGSDLEESFIGKKHGRQIYSLIFKLGFELWNMNRLWLLVLENNKPAHSLYTKVGFKEEGIQRSALFKNGQYHNYIAMSILKNEYHNYKGNNNDTSF